jgi:hypothetical protein
LLGAYDFSLLGGSAGVTFIGLWQLGVETMTGTARADSITVAAANADVVIGGQGNDTINLTAAAAADTVRYAAGDGTDLIQNFSVADVDVFDYTSALVATDGATAIAAGAINGGGLTQVTAAGAVTQVSAAACYCWSVRVLGRWRGCPVG